MVERYRKAGGSVCPVDLVKGMIPLCEKDQQATLGNFTINLNAKSWGHSQIFGSVQRYGNSATIVYSKDLTTCWRRFVVAKELSHLMFDDTEDFTKDPIELVASLLAGIPLSDGARASVTSEQHAVLMAIELILPHSCRKVIEAMSASGSSALKIATKFMVPEKVVETYLNLGYKKMAADCWELRGNS